MCNFATAPKTVLLGLVVILIAMFTSSAMAVTPSYYPIYSGYPPLSDDPFYRDDVTRSIAAGVSSYNIPLYFQPKWASGDPKIGVLLVHGYGAGPLQNLEIQQWWYSRGIASYAIRVADHGISLETLKASNYEAWQASIDGPLSFLLARCDSVFIYGLSTGAALAINAAARYPTIRGLILQAPILKSGDPRFYFFNAVVAGADCLGIDVGQVYIDGDPSSMHYWIPYCVFRGVYQVHRSAARAMRELPNVSVPVMTIASPRDQVADPESNDIIGRRSNAPWVHTDWFGSTHTPLISPNMMVYDDILAYMTAAIRSGSMPTSELPSASIRTQDWSRHDVLRVPDSFRLTAQTHRMIDAQCGLLGSAWDGQIGVSVENGQLGATIWQDRLDHKLVPSFGSFFSASFQSSGIRSSARLYTPIAWQWPLFLEWNADHFRVGTRTPIGSRIQDDWVWLPEIGMTNGNLDIGLNLVIRQGVVLNGRVQLGQSLEISLSI